MRAITLSFLSLSLLVSLASCDPGGSTAATAPAAPTNLAAAALSGGAHLTWQDNADNEEQYMVMRMEVGVDTDYQTLGMTPFDTTQYHDAGPLTSGTTYMYMVMAMNEAGQSMSNEVMFVAP